MNKLESFAHNDQKFEDKKINRADSDIQPKSIDRIDAEPTDVEQTYGILDLISGDFNSPYCLQFFRRKQRNGNKGLNNNYKIERYSPDSTFKKIIYDLWKKGGQPKINYVKFNTLISVLNPSDKYRSNISLEGDQIWLQSTFRKPDFKPGDIFDYHVLQETVLGDFFAELAHCYQIGMQKGWAEDVLKTFMLPEKLGGYKGFSYEKLYETKGSFEHQAHKTIQPKLLVDCLRAYKHPKNTIDSYTLNLIFDNINYIYTFEKEAIDYIPLLDSIDLGNDYGLYLIMNHFLEQGDIKDSLRNYVILSKKLIKSGMKSLGNESYEFSSGNAIEYYKKFSSKDIMQYLFVSDLESIKQIFIQRISDIKKSGKNTRGVAGYENTIAEINQYIKMKSSP